MMNFFTFNHILNISSFMPFQFILKLFYCIYIYIYIYSTNTELYKYLTFWNMHGNVRCIILKWNLAHIIMRHFCIINLSCYQNRQYNISENVHNHCIAILVVGRGVSCCLVALEVLLCLTCVDDIKLTTPVPIL